MAKETNGKLREKLQESRWAALKMEREQRRFGVEPVGGGNVEEDEPAPKPDLSALKGKPAISIVEAAAWVFEMLDCDWVTPADAPSSGAWSLLIWARSSMAARSEFYKMFANKVVSPPQEAEKNAKEKREADHREFMRRYFPEQYGEPAKWKRQATAANGPVLGG